MAIHTLSDVQKAFCSRPRKGIPPSLQTVNVPGTLVAQQVLVPPGYQGSVVQFERPSTGQTGTILAGANLSKPHVKDPDEVVLAAGSFDLVLSWPGMAACRQKCRGDTSPWTRETLVSAIKRTFCIHVQEQGGKLQGDILFNVRDIGKLWLLELRQVSQGEYQPTFALEP